MVTWRSKIKVLKWGFLFTAECPRKISVSYSRWWKFLTWWSSNTINIFLVISYKIHLTWRLYVFESLIKSLALFFCHEDRPASLYIFIFYVCNYHFGGYKSCHPWPYDMFSFYFYLSYLFLFNLTSHSFLELVRFMKTQYQKH